LKAGCSDPALSRGGEDRWQLKVERLAAGQGGPALRTKRYSSAAGKAAQRQLVAFLKVHG
jgi:hypothetical protein